MQSAWLLAEEVPSCIVTGRRLWDFPIWFGLHGMDEVGKAYSILNEEDRDVVSNDVSKSVSQNKITLS